MLKKVKCFRVIAKFKRPLGPSTSMRSDILPPCATWTYDTRNLLRFDDEDLATYGQDSRSYVAHCQAHFSSQKFELIGWYHSKLDDPQSKVADPNAYWQPLGPSYSFCRSWKLSQSWYSDSVTYATSLQTCDLRMIPTTWVTSVGFWSVSPFIYSRIGAKVKEWTLRILTSQSRGLFWDVQVTC